MMALLFKAYVARGVFQATHSKKLRLTYATFSISSLLIGVYTLIHAFSGGIIGLSFWQIKSTFHRLDVRSWRISHYIFKLSIKI